MDSNLFKNKEGNGIGDGSGGEIGDGDWGGVGSRGGQGRGRGAEFLVLLRGAGPMILWGAMLVVTSMIIGIVLSEPYSFTCRSAQSLAPLRHEAKSTVTMEEVVDGVPASVRVQPQLRDTVSQNAAANGR